MLAIKIGIFVFLFIELAYLLPHVLDLYFDGTPFFAKRQHFLIIRELIKKCKERKEI